MRWFIRRGSLVAASVFAFVPAALVAQSDSVGATLRGRVIDARTTRPMPSVVVVITAVGDTVGRAQTDTGGAFVVSTRRGGAAVVHFALTGYRTDSLSVDTAAASRPLRVAMTSAPGRAIAALAPTKVVASNGTTDFDRRVARHAGGVFITEADIEKRKPVRTTDLFRGLLGVSVRDSGGVLQLVSNRGTQMTFSAGATGRAGGAGRAAASSAGPARGAPSQVMFDESSRGPTVDGRKCVLRIGVDAQLMDAAYSVDEIPVNSIRGIEVYIGAATIPVEFSTVQPDSPCGIVMVWTRNRPPRAP